MKLHKIFAGLLISVLLLGLVVVASAGGLAQTDDPPPAKGSFDPVPMRPSSFVLDPSAVKVTDQLESAEDTQPSVPLAPDSAIPGNANVTVDLSSSVTVPADLSSGAQVQSDLELGGEE